MADKLKRPFRLKLYKPPVNGFAELIGINTYASKAAAFDAIRRRSGPFRYTLVERRRTPNQRGRMRTEFVEIDRGSKA